MPPLHHRAPGPVAACLAQAGRGEAVLEVIGDGVHLAAETVRMLFDLVGPQAICLVTDAMAASGMPDGSYTLGGRDVLVADRTARLADGGSIAGGVATLLDVVRWCVAEAGIPLLDAVTAASVTPAQTLGLTGVGSLAAGQQADVVVVDDDLQLRRVLRRGSWLAPDVPRQRPVGRTATPWRSSSSRTPPRSASWPPTRSSPCWRASRRRSSGWPPGPARWWCTPS